MPSLFEAYGGVLDIAHVSNAWAKHELSVRFPIINIQLGLIEDRIPLVDPAAAPMMNPPAVASNFQFINNWRLNAVVSIDDNLPVIGFFAGAPLLLRLYFLALLGDTSLFRRMDDVHYLREAPLPPARTPGAQNILSAWAQAQALAQIFEGVPRSETLESLVQLTCGLHQLSLTDKRLHVAQLLALQAEHFLMFHEMGHIMMGHFDYRRARSGALSYAEFGDKWTVSSAWDMYIQHAFELEADRFAIAKMFEGFFARDKEKKIRLSAPGFIAMTEMTRRSRYRLWFTTIGALFLLLEARRRELLSSMGFWSRLLNVSSHPTPAFRLKHLVEFTSERFAPREAEAKEDLQQAFQEARKDLDAIARRLSLHRAFRHIGKRDALYEARMSKARKSISEEMTSYITTAEQRYKFRRQQSG